MVENKPAKCTKFDAAFVPECCHMKEECKAEMEARAGMLDKTNDRWLEGTGKKLKEGGGV